jgi:hypothetical protein
MITEIQGNMKGRRWTGVRVTYSGLVIWIRFGYNCCNVNFLLNHKRWKEKGYVIEFLYVIDLFVYIKKCRLGCDECMLHQIV